MERRKRHPKWTEIIEKLESSEYKISYIVSNLNISYPYMYQILRGIRPMPDYIKNRFESFFDCRFERPSPEPEKETT